MMLILLAVAAGLFVLWIVGLAAGWAAHIAWTLFVIAVALFLVSAIVRGVRALSHRAAHRTRATP